MGRREHKRLFSPDERRRIIEKGYRDDLSIREIAKILKCSPTSVKALASKHGITAKYPKQRAGKTIGIKIPKSAMLDWNFLTRSKRYSAKEAAQLLGLMDYEDSDDSYIRGS